MKKTIVSVLFAALFAQQSCTSGAERIAVRIDGWGDDTVMVRYNAGSGAGCDTIIARNGRFGYTPPVADSIVEVAFFRKADMYVDFAPSARRIMVMTTSPGQRLTVKGEARADRVVEYKVGGTALMADISEIRAQTLRYEVLKDSNEFRLIAAMEGNLSAEPFFARRRELNAEIRAVERAFIRTNPDRLASGVFAIGQPVSDFAACYDLLTEGVRNGALKALLDKKVRSVAEYRVFQEAGQKEFAGHPAPDFTLTDIDGRPFALSAFDTAGKYVVLDFWGSWCGPCIHGMPRMKEYYEKYRGKLNIIGIACNDGEADWKKAVAEHSLLWIHLINDDTTPGGSVSAHYAIGAYPTKIILSPDKTFLHKFVGEGDDFYTKLDELL